MAKPVEPVPTWCTDEVNMTEPSGAQKTTGWEPGQDGVSDYDNWFKCIVSKWLAYLDTNVLDGDVEVDGNLTVDENLTIVGDTIHGLRERSHSVAAVYTSPNRAGNYGNSIEVAPGISSTSRFEIVGPIVGDRIHSVHLTGNDLGSASPTITLWRADSDGTATAIAHTPTRVGAAGAAFEYTLAITTPTALGEGSRIQVQTVHGGSCAANYFSISHKYDHPAAVVVTAP